MDKSGNYVGWKLLVKWIEFIGIIFDMNKLIGLKVKFKNVVIWNSVINSSGMLFIIFGIGVEGIEILVD